ncbi:MAG: hypothetical protein AAF581_06330 [Planctomycetota bacterium]
MRWIVVALLVTGITVPAAVFVLKEGDGSGSEARYEDVGAGNGGGGSDGSDAPWRPMSAGEVDAAPDRVRSSGTTLRGNSSRDRNSGSVRAGDSSGTHRAGTGGPSRTSGTAGNSGNSTPGGSRAGGTGDGGHGGVTNNGSGTSAASGRAGGSQRNRNNNSSNSNGRNSSEEANPAADIAGGVSVALRVWAEGEQLDLEELTILRVPRPTRNAIHPGPSITEHVVFPQPVTSPVTLPARRGSFIYWAHAPGFSWTSIEVDHSDGGERLLTLSRQPVTLQLTLENFYPESEAVVRIHHDRARGPGVELAAADTIEVAGLPEGKYFVRVEIGDELWNSVLLGESEVTTEKGQIYPVTLALADPPDLEGQVGLSGTLEVPPEWDSSVFAVRVQPLDVPTIQGQTAITVPVADMELVNGALRWSVGLVVPGRYRVLVDPLKLCVATTVNEGEPKEVSLVVPPPTDVRVIVVDAETGNEVDLSRITWVPRGTLRGCQPMWEHRTSINTAFEFVAPVGEIEISNLFVNDWRVDSTRFTLAPGSNDLVVEASPACGIRISLIDGDTPLPLSDLPQSIQVSGLGNTNRIVSWSSEGNWKVARLSGSGQFRVKFGPVRGFRAIPDQNITVPEGEFFDLEVDLVRE